MAAVAIAVCRSCLIVWAVCAFLEGIEPSLCSHGATNTHQLSTRWLLASRDRLPSP